MTTKELINQYVTAHADNRWMDASELEALLTEFAEKLKEPASEDLEKASEEYAYTNWESDDYHEGASEGKPFDAIGHTQKCFIDGAQWQKEQMMKVVAEGKVVAVRTTVSDRPHTYPWIELEAQLSKNDKVKVIIIKE